MTKEYAALLAQVIPVVALAVVLEMREFVKRAVASYTERSDEAVKSQTSWLAVLTLGMAVIQGVLAGGEITALHVAGGSPEVRPPMVAVLQLGIVLAFCIPAAEALIRLAFAMNPARAVGWKKGVWVVGVLVALPLLAKLMELSFS